LSSLKMAVLSRPFSPRDRDRIPRKNDRPARRVKPPGRVFYSRPPAIAADRDPCSRRCRRARIQRSRRGRRPGISVFCCQPPIAPGPG